MEILQIGITLGGICLSCFLTHFLAKKRELKIKNEFKSNLDYATQVDTYRNASQIEKDRFAQLVFNQRSITFSELEYFIRYENADQWVGLYLLHRKNLQLKRESDKVIQDIFSKYSHKKYGLLFVGYISFAFIGLLPLLFWQKYIKIFQEYLISQDYLVIFNIVCYPIFFLVGALIFLNKAENLKSANSFIKYFYATAIKTE